MKTPRDLLLSRHTPAQGRLDALRKEVVAEHVGGPPAVDRPAAPASWARCWREMFWEGRWAWGGLAFVWVAIVVLNLAARESAASFGTSVAANRPARDLRVALGEQARLRAWLLESDAPSPRETPRSAVPGPRSERRFPGLRSPTDA